VAFFPSPVITGVDGDEPPDVRAVLVQLFAEGRKAIEADDTQTAQSVIDSAETVVRNKVPSEQRRKMLLHGCKRAKAGLDSADHDDHTAAVAYLTAMERRLNDE